MVSALMKDMGLGLDWLDRRDNSIVVSQVGRVSRLFYVEDARTATDNRGRKMVPAADFVLSNSVRSVFGVGGGYVDGTFLAFILFTRESVPKDHAETFLPLITRFKVETSERVVDKRFF